MEKPSELPVVKSLGDVAVEAAHQAISANALAPIPVAIGAAIDAGLRAALDELERRIKSY